MDSDQENNQTQPCSYSIKQQSNQINLYHLLPSANQIIPESKQVSQKSIKIILNIPSKQKSQQTVKQSLLPINKQIQQQNQYFNQFKLNQTLLYNKQIKQKIKTKPYFDSNFQSGNLAKVLYKNGVYKCLIEKDKNSNSYGHWFYFSVTGLKDFLSWVLEKKNHSILKGRDGIWRKDGKNIEYKECQGIFQEEKLLYCVNFQYKFERQQQIVYFAYSFPFTYSELNNYLNRLIQNPYKKRYVQLKSLCITLMGNEVPLLSITNRENKNKKSVICISARVHPGETVSSWVAKGLIQYLLSNSIEAQFLRNNFSFKIIPMLNPDGVIMGNYRFSKSACDLNRRWNCPSKNVHPQIFFAKKYLMNLLTTQNLLFYIDLHGHSTQKYSFFYGCQNDNGVKARKFPFFMQKHNQEIFSYEKCQFAVQKNKQGTARITLWRQFSKKNPSPQIYTNQSSFYGGNREWYIMDYLKVGSELAKGFYTILRNSSILIQMSKLLLSNESLMKLGNRPQNGSDSDPSEGANDRNLQCLIDFCNNKELIFQKQKKIQKLKFLNINSRKTGSSILKQNNEIKKKRSQSFNHKSKHKLLHQLKISNIYYEQKQDFNIKNKFFSRNHSKAQKYQQIVNQQEENTPKQKQNQMVPLTLTIFHNKNQKYECNIGNILRSKIQRNNNNGSKKMNKLKHNQSITPKKLTIGAITPSFFPSNIFKKELRNKTSNQIKIKNRVKLFENFYPKYINAKQYISQKLSKKGSYLLENQTDSKNIYIF